MKPRAEQFLRNIQDVASERRGLRVDGQVQRIWGKYWPYEQIISALPQRAEWGVQENYVPFFGDWHEILCLSLSDGRVVQLDDNRNIKNSWTSTEEFIECICDTPLEQPISEAKLIGKGSVSPELKAKAEAFLRAQRGNT